MTTPGNRIIVSDKTSFITINFIMTRAEAIKRGFYFTFGAVCCIGSFLFMANVLSFVKGLFQ